MRKLTESLGFKLVSQCNCGGSLRQTFGNQPRFPDVKIMLRPSKDSFELHKSNTCIKRGKTIEKLTLALQENGIIKTPEIKEEPQATEQVVSESEADN